MNIITRLASRSLIAIVTAVMLCALSVGAVATAEPAGDGSSTTPTTTATPATPETTSEEPAPTTSEQPSVPSVPASGSASVPSVPSVPSSSSASKTTSVTPPAGTYELNVVSWVNDGGNGTPLPGVAANVKNSAGQVWSVITPGQLFLPAGHYTIGLDSVPRGYVVEHLGTIDLGQPDGGTITVVLRKTGGAHAGRAVIVKKDRLTGANLAGARFAIRTCGGDAIAEVTTYQSGIAVPLNPGCYRATEIAAPRGYLREVAVSQFQVRSNADTDVTFYDLPIGYVAKRNPAGRVPVSSIPSGPVNGR